MKHLMNHEKHYITFNNYLKNRFHGKVYRVALNCGFTCPNRDGTKSTKGCLYCSSKLSGDFAGNINSSLQDQFKEGISLMSKKWDANNYIAYLQAGTNTYGDVEYLKKLYFEIINLNPNIKVISIATRPDCINKEICELLKELSNHIEVWIELGLQTIHEETQKFLNLQYNTNDFIKSINLLNEYHIKTIVHIINGLPFETKDMMIETAKFLNQFNLFGLKIHMLHVMKETPLGDMYLKEPFKLLTLDEFVEISVTQLRYTNTKTIIHRLTGDAPKDLLIEPLWTLKKFVVLNEIDKYMRKNNIYQGDLC